MFMSPSSLTLNSTSTLNQSSTPLPSPFAPFSLGSRSTRSSELSSAMPPAGAIGYPYSLNWISVINLLGQPNPSCSISSLSDLPGPTTYPSTSAGSTFTAASTSTLPFPVTSITRTVSLPVPVPSHSATSSTSSLPPVSTSCTSSSMSLITSSPFADPTATVVFSTTTGPSGLSPLNLPSTSTYTITYVISGLGGTATDFVTSSGILSTEFPGNATRSTVPFSPGAIVAIVLGIVGAFAFAALWLFCASRRHRRLVQEATLFLSENHASGPLDDEIHDADQLAYDIRSNQGGQDPMRRPGQVVEERYASTLAALHSTTVFGRGNEEGSTGGVYGSHRDAATDMDEDEVFARASSPTLPLDAIPPDDPPYMVSLSPPPPVSLPSSHQTTHPAHPPSAYYMTSRVKGSPGPDAAAWIGGYSVAPSCNSHYARSQTLGSGSGSGSVDALTRTRTGSEEPLLGIGKAISEASAGISISRGVSPTVVADSGSNRLGLGSAFGSPAPSMYSPSGVYTSLQYDTSGSQDGRSASGSGSYGYARSRTPSSFNALRSVSSQGALSSAYSHSHNQGQGFRFGFSKSGSSSSGSPGKKAENNRHAFGVPPTSFRAWKDRVSATSEKERQDEKQSLREKDWRQKTRDSMSASTSESSDEKQGRRSPARGVRALLGRLRRAGHTPSPHSSNKDLPSPIQASMDTDPEKAAADRVTPPPIQIQVATPQRRRHSFILSNPDPRPPSLYSGVKDVARMSGDMPHPEHNPIQHEVTTGNPYDTKPFPSGSGGLQPTFPTGYVFASAPSPVPTEESRLAEGLLHPRLQTQGCSDASLRDFEDYSRPIGGVVKNRVYSTTTFGTQEDIEASPNQGTPVRDDVSSGEHEHAAEAVNVFGASTPTGISRDSWFINDLPPSTTVPYLPSRRE